MRQLSNVRSYLKVQLAPFSLSFFESAIVPIEGLRVVFWWAAPATLAVLFIAQFRNLLPASYLEAAISDGIGPHIWNVVGMLGLVLFGLAVLFPKAKFIATGAYQVLINAYGMGGLAIGLLIGKILAQLPPSLSKLELWKAWFAGTGVTLLMLELFVLNFSLWCFSSLMRPTKNDHGFLYHVENIDLRLRLFVFIFLSILPPVIFLIRGH
ncbi:hypothetical protein [Burkholderia cenocepacia]|uniref:hypothetical protein n=1 Tax=Burkholderia cenocepacia TaxID=95486 RepID=UPI0028597778|nr:hypothetical protein [Burkholderia cenocepacia]MDR5660166.1 hypothetical protein [Burkholderia cenocepacia]MDR8093325.1 hypothetical protein [Burkholderia cenocepacia]